MSDTLNFLHRSMGITTKTTLLDTKRKNNITTWTFLKESNIEKFLPDSITTTLGHQYCTRKNHQSTQRTTLKTTENRYINIYASIKQPEIPTGEIHSDQTGRFPIQSSSGNKYIIVIYEYDPNAILIKPLPDRSKESIVQAYQKIIQHLTRRGFKPRLQRLDNEAYKLLQDDMDKNKIQ